MIVRVLIVVLVLVAVAGAALFFLMGADAPVPHVWSDAELAMMATLSIDSLPPLPSDPSNDYGDDPRAAALGQRLFFDSRFSANGEISCSTCHQPDRHFTDGKPRAEAIGTTKRHTPTIIGAAYNPWYFWDGRKDSQWSQALGPMEDQNEHGGTRTQYAHLVARSYAAEYEAIFGPLPDLSALPPSAGPFGKEAEQEAWNDLTPGQQDGVNRVYANMGKAIAAYERRILPGRSRFDDYVEAARSGDRETMARIFDDSEALGLRLFLTKANCTQCHNGPLLSNRGFHNIGLPLAQGESFDEGRVAGVQKVRADIFNCMSDYSDAGEGECPELRFVKAEGDELVGSLKVPTLRNVAETAPYMHRGQVPTLAGVLAHYNQAPTPVIGHTDLVPLELSAAELGQLEAFLRTLSGPLTAPEELLRPPPVSGGSPG